MGKKRLPPQSMDMQFSRPEKSVCQTCRFRKPDYVFERADGSIGIITQWDNAECEKYIHKPMEVLFDDANCVFYESE